MGFLSKVSKAIFGKSNGPKYNVDEAAKQAQYGVNSALGNMNIVRNADGTYSKNYTTTTGDAMRNSLIEQGLGTVGLGLNSYSLDPTQASQAYYDQATRLMDDKFNRERTSTDTNLINRGIQVGTEQYKNTMGDLINNQNKTYQDLANQAVYLGQQNLGQQISNLGGQIGNINALGAGRDVYGVAALGGNNQAYENAYNAAQYNYQNQANKNQQVLNAGAALGSTLLFSDKRLKENLKTVGKLNNGLKVYVGNYKKETGLDTTPQLFLVAQEVKKKHPEAVAKKYGALAVNYKEAVKEK